jgi:hypothetical protein
MGKPVRSSIDFLEIRGLLAEYALAADECRFEDWAKLFTREGEMQSPSRTIRGYEALVDFISSAAEGLHLCAHPRIEISSDRGSATTPFLFVPHGGSPSRGIYYDTLLRTEAGWRIACRRGRLLHSNGS